MEFETLRYERDGRVARITLNRPHRGNAIVDPMPQELRRAVETADADDSVHVIVLAGEGKIFCGGYDLTFHAEEVGDNAMTQSMPWDPVADYRIMGRYTDDYMSIWRSLTPVIVRVQGAAVAGGSDIALCGDLLVMESDAVIGYPPARIWGCPTTMMWAYRVGIGQAKRMLLTGDLISGVEAERIGLAIEAAPLAELDDAVDRWVARISAIPRNQLAMQKLALNQAYANMGLHTTQLVATLFDGASRHTAEGLAFRRRTQEVGWKGAVAERDSGAPIVASSNGPIVESTDHGEVSSHG